MYYDVVIIGSGPAGIAAAEKLINSKLKVLIVDCGNDTNIQNYQSEKWTSRGNFSINFNEERKKAFFGTTALWKKRGVGGHLWEFDKYDFLEILENDTWNKWNINYSEILSAYKDAKNFFNINEDLGKNDFKKKLKSERQLQDLFRLFDIKIASTYYSKKDHYEKFILKKKKKLIESNNIDLLLNTNLEKIILNKNKSRVDKLSFSDVDGCNIEVFCNDIVISSGCFANNKILFELESQNNLHINNLGKYITFHPSIHIGRIQLNNNEFFYKKDINKFPKAYLFNDKKLKIKNNFNFGIGISPVIKEKPLKENIIKRINYIKSAIENRDFILLIKNIISFIISGDFTKYVLKKIYNHFSKIYEFDVNIVFEHLADKDNFITFSDKDRSFIINASVNKKNILLLENTINNVQENITKIYSKFNPVSNNYNKIIFETNNHHHGGTIIDTRNKEGVVDSNLKLKNFENIYICGSSVFPSSSIYNPTLTIVALGIRLSKFILNKN